MPRPWRDSCHVRSIELFRSGGSPGSPAPRWAGAPGSSPPATSPSRTKASQFGFPEVRLGLVPAVISTFVLRKTGAAPARRYFLTGEIFGPEEARRMGLVHEVVPAGRARRARRRARGRRSASAARRRWRPPSSSSGTSSRSPYDQAIEHAVRDHRPRPHLARRASGARRLPRQAKGSLDRIAPAGPRVRGESARRVACDGSIALLTSIEVQDGAQ